MTSVEKTATVRLVPQGKYSTSVSGQLYSLADDETPALREQLAERDAEIERLKALPEQQAVFDLQELVDQAEDRHQQSEIRMIALENRLAKRDAHITRLLADREQTVSAMQQRAEAAEAKATQHAEELRLAEKRATEIAQQSAASHIKTLKQRAELAEKRLSQFTELAKIEADSTRAIIAERDSLKGKLAESERLANVVRLIEKFYWVEIHPGYQPATWTIRYQERKNGIIYQDEGCKNVGQTLLAICKRLCIFLDPPASEAKKPARYIICRTCNGKGGFQGTKDPCPDCGTQPTGGGAEKPIRYAERKWTVTGCCPDGTPIVETRVCTQYTCQKWIAEVANAPLLVVDDRGFRICPVCKMSYGQVKQQPERASSADPKAAAQGTGGALAQGDKASDSPLDAALSAEVERDFERGKGMAWKPAAKEEGDNASS